MPLMVMAIPLYDLTSVTLIRLSCGQSPLKGDHNHFSHRLVRQGLSQRRACWWSGRVRWRVGPAA
ncbi:MAG: hypothetical protein R3C45_16810 [Phycisphaerales bacterium]